MRNYLPTPLEVIPKSIPFESPAEAKGFSCNVVLTDTNIDILKGITGVIIFKNLTVQCLAIYGCLIRKEEISIGSNQINKCIIQSNISFCLPEHTAYIRRAQNRDLPVLLLHAEKLFM